MNKPLVSIIIPIYKVEKYLDQCISSVVNQTYENLEIILVDDGSPDLSGKIADEWMKKDSRIKVIHQKNSGLSVARNTGVKKCHGKWIAFVDSDDYISIHYIDQMMKAALKMNVKVVLCDYIEVNGETGELNSPEVKVVPGVYNKEKFWQTYYQNHLPIAFITAWSKLYHQSIFENLSFKKGILNEDEEIIYSIIQKAKYVAVIEDSLYYYRVNRSGSIMNKINVNEVMRHSKYSIFEKRIGNMIKDNFYNLAGLCDEQITFLLFNDYTHNFNKKNKIIFMDEFKRLKNITAYLKKYGVRFGLKFNIFISFPFLVCFLKRLKIILFKKCL